MKLNYALLLTGVLFSNFAGTGAAAEDAQKIVEQAEFIRNPQENYTTRVVVVDVEKDKKDQRVYETLIKGRDKALVKFLEPPSDAGTRVLLLDSDMWIYMPSSAKPLRISPRQKLAGNAAYGDVARLNFNGNYTAKILRKDRFEGKEAYVLELTAMEDRPVTYDKVEYWVAVDTKRPLKALYKTVSDKVIREGYFDAYQKVFGVERPTVFKLIDNINKDHVTTMTFSGMKEKDFPDLLFQKQNLGRE